MGRRERPIDPDDGPLQDFAYRLRELRRAAGSPSYRELARHAHFSDTSLSVAASGTVLPSLEVTLGYVRACGGDVAEWEQRWSLVAGPLGASPAPTPGRRHTGAVGSGLASVPSAPAQLPHSAAEFTGRVHDLHMLDGLLEDSAASTDSVAIAAISGAPGVGKTALAVHWARRVSHRFPDGQLYVDLHGYSSMPPLRPIDALGQLLRGLGIDPQQQPVDTDEAAALFRSAISSRRVLILLDNAAASDQVRPLLPGNPQCLVLVTSRDRLSGLVASEGARPIVVEVFRPSESVTLLTKLVGDDRVRAEPVAAAALASLCAHLPLALRIAAAHLVIDPRRQVGHFTTDLERSGDNRLSALEVRGDTAAAVRATFDLSYTALPAEARRAFRRLGLAPGADVTAETIAVLAGTTRQKGADLLGRLAAAHLVGEYTTGRFRCHDLLRLYSRHRAQADDSGQARHAAVGRLLAWYLGTADRAASLLYSHLLRAPVDPDALALASTDLADDNEALAWFDAERPNLTAAITYGAAHGHPKLAWLLADTLRGYFALRRHMVDWLTMAGIARDAAAAAGDITAESAAWLSLAHAYWCVGDYPAAADHYAAALERAVLAGWTDGQATILGNLGLVYWEVGRLEEATDHLSRALCLDRDCGRQLGAANHLANLGYMYRSLGRPDEAAASLTEALSCYRELGSTGGEANALVNLGLVYQDLGKPTEAMTMLRDALARYQRIGDRSNEAGTWLSLAVLHADLGEHASATDLAQSALRVAREIGDRRAQADALNALGHATAGLGDREQAASHHASALDLARGTGARYQEAEALIGLSRVRAGQGDTESARSCAARALEIAEETGDYRLRERARVVTAGAWPASAAP